LWLKSALPAGFFFCAMAVSASQALLGASGFEGASAPPLSEVARPPCGAGPQATLTRSSAGAAAVRKGLVELGMAPKLADVLAADDERIGLRVYLLDNSGSTGACDGCVLRDLGSGRFSAYRGVSRWEEITAMALDHAWWNLTIGVTCEFVLLNSYTRDQRLPPQAGRDFLRVDRQLGDPTSQLQLLGSWLTSNGPRGVTPLSARLDEIRLRIQSEYQQLAQQGQMVFLTIATDGLPTSPWSGDSKPQDQQEFKERLRRICVDLPVQLVIRLCTDDKWTMDFYNQIDKDLELPLDIIDDFVSEAAEFARAGNGWFSYTPLLHRVREAGTLCRLFDALDEAPLAPSQARRFADMLCNKGAALEECSDRDFLRKIEHLTHSSPRAFDPLTGKMRPPLNTLGLRKAMKVGFRGTILPAILPFAY